MRVIENYNEISINIDTGVVNIREVNITVLGGCRMKFAEQRFLDTTDTCVYHP
jgi:hypothetical protein